MLRDSRHKREKKPFKRYPTGYLYNDISEICTGVGKAYVFVSVDQTSNFSIYACIAKCPGRSPLIFSKRRWGIALPSPHRADR